MQNDIIYVPQGLPSWPNDDQFKTYLYYESEQNKHTERKSVLELFSGFVDLPHSSALTILISPNNDIKGIREQLWKEITKAKTKTIKKLLYVAVNILLKYEKIPDTGLGILCCEENNKEYLCLVIDKSKINKNVLIIGNIFYIDDLIKK